MDKDDTVGIEIAIRWDRGRDEGIGNEALGVIGNQPMTAAGRLL
jgi:hypothetical protein